MDTQTMDALPYSQPFYPTIRNVARVGSFLRTWFRIPPELSARIFSYAYNPWLLKRRNERIKYPVMSPPIGNGFSIAGLYLSSEPIPDRPALPKRVIFQARAADQGWATWCGEGTLNNSHTWFEASILRLLGTAANGAALEDVLQDPWYDPQSARTALRAQGWDFVEKEDGGVTWKLFNNITASSEYRTYTAEWTRGVQTEETDERVMGSGEGFIELLEPNHIVVLWARAEQGMWCNDVGAATIEIEYEL
ncbi:hypothetical protein F4781DRAFT_372075 [Annulohypoxylon bovei var. microspora]|nr:hypothetical protein F4781DRAFT_372075 [Annulohypoxylon bovei var. microspora]